MPLQYAVQEIIPLEGRSLEDSHRWNSEVKYHPVPQDVAETHEQGCLALFSNNGTQVTPWILFNSEYSQMKAKKAASSKSGNFKHKDIMGEELAIGDYVAVTHMETAELSVGKVIAFTEKKIRIMQYGGYFDAVLKNPSGIIKIQPNVLSD